MTIGTPYATAVIRHGNSNSTSDDITVGESLAADDLLIMWTYRSSGGSVGHPAASSTGWTSTGQYDPTSNFKGIVDVFAKYVEPSEVGTTPTYTVEWNEATEFGKVIGVTAVPNGDLNSVTMDFAEYDDADSVTFPADSGDLTFHVLGNDPADQDQSGDFPSGDTLLGWSGDTSFRNAGFAISGGNTASGDFGSELDGSFGNISISELVSTGQWIEGAPSTFTTAGTNDPPSITILSPTPGEIRTVGVDVVVAGTVSDDSAGVAVDVRYNNGAYAPAVVTGTAWAITLSGLAEGLSINLDARATDADGATATDSVSFAMNQRAVITSQVGISEGDVLTAGSAFPAITVNGTDNDGGIRYWLLRLQNLDTSEYWNGVTGEWVADQYFNNSPSFPPVSESSYTFADGVDGLVFPSDLGAGVSYVIRYQPVDVQQATQAQSRFFSTTFGGEIVSPVDGFVIDEDTTTLDVSGTSAGSPSLVEVLVNGVATVAVDTGSGFDTWEALGIDLAAAGLAPGDAVPVQLRLDGTIVDSLGGVRWNARPTAILSGIDQGQQLATSAPIPPFSIAITDANNDDIELVRYRLQRVSDGAWWDNDSAWVTPTVWHSLTPPTPIPTPGTYTYVDGVDGLTLPALADNETYELYVSARDILTGGVNDWSASDVVTFTAQDPSSTGEIVSPVDGFVIDEDTTTLDVSGTSAGSPSLVEVLVNGVATVAVDTGSGFDTWEALGIDLAAAGLAPGDAVSVQLRLDGTIADALTGVRWNGRPVIGNVTGITPNQELPANAPLPTFTALGINDADGDDIVRVAYHLNRLSDGLYWDNATQDWSTTWTWGTALVNYPGASLPASHTFADGIDGFAFPLDLGQGLEYLLLVYVFDEAPSDPFLIPFSTGVPITGEIVSPVDGFVIDEDVSTLVVSGTSAGSPSLVEVWVNGTAHSTVDTGSGTWSASVDLSSAGLAPGDAVPVQLRLDGTNVDALTGVRWNEAPTGTGITMAGIDGTTLPAGTSTLPEFTLNGIEDLSDGVSNTRYRLRRLSDGLYWSVVSSAWETASTFDTSTGLDITAAQMPYDYTFVFGTDGFEAAPPLEDGEDYELTAQARDDSGTLEWSDLELFNFSVASPFVNLGISHPPHGSVDVASTGTILTGPVDDSATSLQLRVINMTDGTVLTATGEYVEDSGDNHSLTPTRDTSTDTWTYGPIDFPVGASMRVEVQHL